MVIIRRMILIIVLLWLAFVFYRFLDPQWADALVSKIRWSQIVQTISDSQNQTIISTWDISSWTIDTSIINTWTVQTWTISTWKIITWVVATWNVSKPIVNTWTVKTWSNKTWYNTSWETIWVIDDMNWFSEVIDTTASIKLIKWDLSYKNSDYNFSISFPWSWDGYTIENFTWKDVKAQFVFSFDKKDYFILYIVSNSYYNAHKSSELSYLTYLAQDTTNTFAYKILEKSDTKSKAVPYILKTFKLNDSIVNTPITTTVALTTVKQVTQPTTKKKSTSDWNYIKNIFDSFVK